MTTTKTTRQRFVATFATVTLALLAAGCTGDPQPSATPTPSPSPTVEAEPSPETSPTLDEAAQLKQDNIDAAKERLIAYYEEDSQVANDAYQDWERLQGFWGSPEVSDPLSSAYNLLREQGQYTEGASRVDSMTVTDYVEDPSGSGAEQVGIEACIDSSQVRTFSADGAKVDRGDTPERFKADFTLQHMGEGEHWAISRFAATEQPC